MWCFEKLLPLQKTHRVITMIVGQNENQIAGLACAGSGLVRRGAACQSRAKSA
jgi:hypothetical protein